jgi:hypothetical protein
MSMIWEFTPLTLTQLQTDRSIAHGTLVSAGGSG